MSVTDPIANMFTSIRNANAKLFESLDVPASKFKEQILEIFKKEGFIKNYNKVEEKNKKVLRIALKYGENKEKVITGIKRVSTPGLRIYKDVARIPKIRSGLGVTILSTSKGLMTGREAKKQNIGGEIIGYIW